MAMSISVILPPMPDVELALMFALVPLEPDIRFVTVMPAGDLSQITARIRRVSGTVGRHIYIDHPVVDIDVWGQTDKGSTQMDVSKAALQIQADMQSLMSAKVMNGVIQHISVVSGPKNIPEESPKLVRYNAAYLVRIHP
jgi:hypothetical protein